MKFTEEMWVRVKIYDGDKNHPYNGAIGKITKLEEGLAYPFFVTFEAKINGNKGEWMNSKEIVHLLMENV